MAKKVSIEVEIKNIKKVADLKNELKSLRKEQIQNEKYAKSGKFTSKEQEKQYISSKKAIKEKSVQLRALNKNLSDSNKETKKVTKSSNGMAKQFVKGAAAIGIIVTAFRMVSKVVSSLVSTFSDFEFVMAKVNAVSGATENEFKSLNKSAEDLGRSTFFTATQVGELQLAYSKLGFTAQEILDATQATLDLATATGTDLARAAQVAGASIRGFQLDASEAGRVVDVMAVAFSSSALDIEKWNTSMTKVAPIAAMAGFEIEEVAAIMGKLSDTGIEASIAGTSLRNIFLKMQDPSSKLSKTLGHTITNLDEMLIAFKGLQDEGTDLTDVLGFMDIRQVAAFGTMLEGSDDIATLRDALLNATGEGGRMADMVGDTLQGAFLKLKSAAEGVSISIMKNFGGSLKKSIVAISKWMNSLVGSDKAVKSFTDSITTLGKWMGRGIKIFLAWKIGIAAISAATVIAGVATKAWTALIYLQTFGVQAFTLATGYATAATLTFTRALARTGIGLIVIALGDLVYNLVSFNKEASAAIDWQDKLNKEMKGGEESIKIIEKRYEALSKAKKQINSLTDKEGKLIVDNAVNRDKLKTALFNENKEVANLNKTFKANNKELINNKTNIDNVRGSLDDLLDGMKSQLAAEIFLDMEKGLIKTVVSAETIMEDMKKAFNWMDDAAVKQIAKAMTEYEGTTLNWLAQYGNDAMNLLMGVDPGENNKMLDKLLEEHDLTLGTFLEAVQSGYFEDKTSGIKAAIEEKFGEINLDLNVDGDGGDDKGKKDAQFEIAEKIAARIKIVKDKQIENEIEYQKQLLQAKIDGVEDYLAQENNLSAGEIAAKIQLNDLLRKQRQANNQATLQDERDSAAESLIVAKENYIDKVDSLFQYQNNVNKINKELLEAEYKLLDEEQKLGKEGLAIQDKLLTLEVNKKKNALAESIRLIKQDFNDKVFALELEQSTTIMNKIEFDNRMLQLELEYLLKKKDLHEGNALELIDVNNSILSNNISVNEAQKQLFEQQISAMGGVGSALTSLAGDNEKLNKVKEAGNAISQAANVISSVMALQENLVTLGLIKSTAAQAASTAATVTDNAVTGAGLGIKATDTILSSAKGLGPFGIIAMIAMAAMVMKVMNMFEKGGIIEGGKKFANGGMVHGKSHAQGGEKFAVGGRVAELEGGEAVINKKSTAMFKGQLSAMNAAGGGVKFADGGLMNMPSFASSQFDATNQQNMMGAMSQSNRVVVVEADITTSQKTVGLIEAEATF
jgi:TP901 family phage tail tape measure protein